jgi:hypothetical protein
MKRLILTLAIVAAAAAPAAVASPPILRVAPTTLNFGTRAVGTETIRSALITNSSASPVLVTFDIVSMPDDFGFEAPGFTCPPAGGFVLAPSESCEATAAFRPSEFFAGLVQTAAVRVVASDPSTGTVLASELLRMTGTGK